MHNLQALSLASALVLTAIAIPAFAQGAGDRTRCAILGPMTVSAWFGLLENANQGDRAANREAMTTLNNAVELYNNTGCPASELEATLDCITRMAMAGQITEGAGPAAQSCMAEAGLPRP